MNLIIKTCQNPGMMTDSCSGLQLESFLVICDISRCCGAWYRCSAAVSVSTDEVLRPYHHHYSDVCFRGNTAASKLFVAV